MPWVPLRAGMSRSVVFEMPRKRVSENKDEQIYLRIHSAHVTALESLVPGLGSNVPEVIRFIVIDYLQTKYGSGWMKEKKLIK